MKNIAITVPPQAVQAHYNLNGEMVPITVRIKIQPQIIETSHMVNGVQIPLKISVNPQDISLGNGIGTGDNISVWKEGIC